MTLRNVDSWRRRLGFLPVPLYGRDLEQQFVLLNGYRGNFCLDVGDAPDGDRGREFAWSADVDHYIAIKDKVHVFRWDQKTGEVYETAAIESQLQAFQGYLESKALPRERSIVSRAMRVYRTLRARAGRTADGYTALLAFLELLSEASKRQRSIAPLAEKWADSKIAGEALRSSLRASDIEQLVEALLGESEEGNIPDVELMIRHAAGRIFQEAHYLAYVNPQGDFFSAPQATPTARSSGATGAFFTPTPLVRTVVEQSLATLEIGELSEIRIFDPACGSGEFLREVVRQLEMGGYTGNINVIGYDVSKPACAMARFLLAAEQARWRGRMRYQVDERDSLNGASWPTNVHCCVMNPPFLSWRGMSGQQKAAVSAALGNLQGMRPDMASAFLVLAERSLARDGVLGAVLPASILDGDSAENLRESLNDRLQFLMLARLGSQQIFADAVVDPGLIVARRKDAARPLPTTLVWADHVPSSSEQALRVLRKSGRQVTSGPIGHSENFSVYVVNDIRDFSDNWAPRPLEAAQLLRQLKQWPRVRDLFSVQQGTITGANAVFLLTQSELDSLPRAERKYFRPAIVNDSISNGQIKPGMWVFYPYGKHLSALKSEKDLRLTLAEYYANWLLPNKAVLSSRARINKEAWWDLQWPRPWQQPICAKIVSTYFGAAGSFAWDQSGSYVVVQGYGWVPVVGTIDDPTGLCLLAYLTSSVTDQLLSAVSNNLAGGQWNLSKRFIEKMPVPDMARLPDAAKEQLAEYGQAIINGVMADKRELDSVVRAIFNLTPENLA